MNDKKLGMIYCYVQNIDENSKPGSVFGRNYEGNVLFEHMAYFIATTSTWFCPKRVLEDIGGFEVVPSQQDTTTLLNMLVKGYNIYRVPEILLNFYKHSDDKGITKKTYSYVEDVKNYNEKCRKYFYMLNKKQVRIVECNFAYKLFDLYFALNDKNNSREQLIIIIKNNLFSLRTAKRIYLFAKLLVGVKK